MRALKGIRKGDAAKLDLNLMIAFSWLMTLANRFQIDLTNVVWQRFPSRCSYCRTQPCSCRERKVKRRLPSPPPRGRPPATLAGFQQMFANIYPPVNRTLPDAGIHLAEEIGEVSEAIHVFQGEHTPRRFAAVRLELADYVSCFMGVANSAEINVATSLAKLFWKNCHVCHHLPCTCDFTFVADFQS